MDDYKFNIHELQSYMLSENKGKINKEMMHVIHYHGVDNIPLFQKQVDLVMKRDANEPVRMKFLSNTPLAQRHGINMLLPVAVSAEALHQLVQVLQLTIQWPMQRKM